MFMFRYCPNDSLLPPEKNKRLEPSTNNHPDEESYLSEDAE